MYCPWLGFYFVYSLTNESATAIIATITYTFNYIELQFGVKVKILKIDRESSLINSNEFDEFKRDKGIIIKISAPNVHE